MSALHLKFLKCLLTCLWFFLLIQGCREREGNRQSPKWAHLSEKCFWATEEKEQRKEILLPTPQTPKNNQTCVHSTPWCLGILLRTCFWQLSALLCALDAPLLFSWEVTKHTLLYCSEFCQRSDKLLIWWEGVDLLGDTSCSKFSDLDSSLLSPVQKHVLCQGKKREFEEGGWEDERCCGLTELWSSCVDMGGGITFRALRPGSSHS